MAVEITTNRHHRHFLYGYEVPQKTHEWYDHLSEDERHDGWVCYRGHWSHISDYLASYNPPDWLRAWDGYKPDGFFCGVVISISDDCETYQIGTYISRSDND
jgi:hypothetical protein